MWNIVQCLTFSLIPHCFHQYIFIVSLLELVTGKQNKRVGRDLKGFLIQLPTRAGDFRQMVGQSVL